jgi:hypothetical protein
MDPEVAKVVRGLGIVLALFAALMLALIPFIGPVMTWMDVPMLVIGVVMIVVGHVQLKKAGH